MNENKITREDSEAVFKAYFAGIQPPHLSGRGRGLLAKGSNPANPNASKRKIMVERATRLQKSFAKKNNIVGEVFYRAIVENRGCLTADMVRAVAANKRCRGDLRKFIERERAQGRIEIDNDADQIRVVVRKRNYRVDGPLREG